MCDACVQQNLARYSKPLENFLDKLGVPVLVLDADANVTTANTFARDLLGVELPSTAGIPGGRVLECFHSLTGEGCDKTVHSMTCTIRHTVLETFSTGRPCEARAYPDDQVGREEKTTCLAISTEKVGDCVLLRIDDVRKAESAAQTTQRG